MEEFSLGKFQSTSDRTPRNDTTFLTTYTKSM